MMILSAPWNLHSDDMRKCARDSNEIVTFDQGRIVKIDGKFSIVSTGRVGDAAVALAELEAA